MEDKIQTFRQPMVTATGIILGFVLNFVASWVKTDSPVGDGLAYLIGLCVVAGTASLILVLFRISTWTIRAEGPTILPHDLQWCLSSASAWPSWSVFR